MLSPSRLLLDLFWFVRSFDGRLSLSLLGSPHRPALNLLMCAPPERSDVMKKFAFVSEIIPKRLYFAVCQKNKCPANTGSQLMLYFNYNVRKIEKCFGPPNIGLLHEYINEMRSMLGQHPDKTLIHTAYTNERETTTNSMFLCGAFAIVDLGYDPVTVSRLVIAKNLITWELYILLLESIQQVFCLLQPLPGYHGEQLSVDDSAWVLFQGSAQGSLRRTADQLQQL